MNGAEWTWEGEIAELRDLHGIVMGMGMGIGGGVDE